MQRSLRTWLTLGSCLVLQAIGLMVGVRCASAALGVVNQQVNYQAKLMDASGGLVSDGTYNMLFSLYTQSSGGTPIWTASGTTVLPTAIPVSVSNGLFTVMLGDTSASGGWQNTLGGVSWDSSTLYLGVTVGSDSEMSPRKRIGAVPQALNALQLQGMYASSTADSGALFKINQTSSTSMGVNRSALDVATAGASADKDFIMRLFGPASASVPRFSVRNDGYTSGIASTTGAVISGTNLGDKALGNTWGGWFNRFAVGSGGPEYVTGTNDFSAVIRYEANHQTGLCIDDANTSDHTCAYHAGSSLVTEGTINASDFDLAEQYRVTGVAEPGDVLTVDPDHPMFVERSPGVAYDRRVIGIASTKPGLLLGDLSDDDSVKVALAGRVPTKVSVVNGVIAIGDALTASPIPGVAMKATAVGSIVGYALQAATATSTIEVFVKVGYDASPILRAGTDGKTTLQGDVVLAAAADATPTASAGSWGLTFRGSVWNGLVAESRDFVLQAQAHESSRVAFALNLATSTLWSVDDAGSMRTTGDLLLGGKFFPATRSGVQSDKYVFLDDEGSASSTYVATNADGWQANDSYDFAERYYSPDALTPGDLVVISQRGQLHVQRTLTATDVSIGIVSTRPGFVAGAPGPSTYPIALAGRVPTKVSTLNGNIAVGDPLTASNLPGVAVKALQAGPIVGYALQEYTAPTVGSIEVFVNAGWWGGSPVVAEEKTASAQTTIVVTATTTSTVKSFQGVARILAGSNKVTVTHPTLGTFPLLQVTPYGKVDTQWWTDHSSDRGFEILLKEPLGYDVTFSWRAEEMQTTDDQLFLSDGTVGRWDIHSGDPIYSDTSVVLPEVTSTSVDEGTSVVTTTEPILPVTTTSTDPVVEIEPTPATSTEPVTVEGEESSDGETSTTTTEPAL